MTSGRGIDSPPQRHRQTILHRIEAASRYVPSAQSPASALQSLRELIPSLPAASAMAETDDGPPTSAQETLGLASMANNLLSLLDKSSSANPLGWETLGGIKRVLDELTDQLGTSIRREQAKLIRGLYVIIDPTITGGRDPLVIAQAAIQGGADAICFTAAVGAAPEPEADAVRLVKVIEDAGGSI